MFPIGTKLEISQSLLGRLEGVTVPSGKISSSHSQLKALEGNEADL